MRFNAHFLNASIVSVGSFLRFVSKRQKNSVNYIQTFAQKVKKDIWRQKNAQK